MSRLALKLAVLATFALIVACAPGRADGPTDRDSASLEDYSDEVLAWREERLAKLKAPGGYLNQIGLYWLRPGRYSLGADRDNDIVLPDTAAPLVGHFAVSDSSVGMTVADGVKVVLRNAGPVSEIDMASDLSDEPTVLDHGSLSWMLIDRAGRLGIRLRDYAHPFVETFGPLPYYEVDPALKVVATLERYPEARIANVATVIEGLPYNPLSPGIVSFDIDGASYELEAYISGDELFFVFGDLTNRDETYGAGRFLYAPMPGDDGKTILDFNKAYSPPCAFNDFSTCPVASPRNRLQVRVEAGEKYDPALHYSGES